MANVFTWQILQDGNQKVVANIQGTLDTADLPATDVLDPATLLQTNPLTTQLRIDRISTTSKTDLLCNSCGMRQRTCKPGMHGTRTNVKFWKEGGLQNNAGAGKTGKIQLLTTGWVGVKHFSILLDCTKQ